MGADWQGRGLVALIQVKFGPGRLWRLSENIVLEQRSDHGFRVLHTGVAF